MQCHSSKSVLLFAAPLLFAGTAVWAGQGVDVTVTNDSTEDLVVTVYDESIGPNAVVLSRAHMNGFTSIPVTVATDASGHAKVSWTATTADANFRKCGHESDVVLGDASSLTVHADSSCNPSSI
jgi:hypothetical protein